MATTTEHTHPPKPSFYKSDRKPVWCAGCGDYGVLNSIFSALARIEVDPNNLVVTSGIGCSSRMPGFIKAYGFHGAHGRALPVAVGVKVANPELEVLVVGGDGDGFSIGGGHVAHVCRRNVDMTYIVMDNQIYGLTKGQTSPTSEPGTVTKASPYGTVEAAIQPVALMLSYGATYVARGYSSQPKELAELIERGIRHKGFSFIHVLSPCVTFNKAVGYDYFGSHSAPIPKNHKLDDLYGAIRMTGDPPDTFYLGVFYEVQRPTYGEQVYKDGRRPDPAPPIDTERIIQRYS
ncbi:MAG: 2-oxoacid:ferredoxin oxidoreductase subunit beta [Candidatus Eisenbacteria bacterium]|nr:2-oxoacid:ferredoxin oxidoreductase subunit beta [Candidatus Latescibacterota bacterium]MBD3302814.1 2-oxoacid:ferredoxin oxidoreductase subunit beta [Candidatus Eisenbacteria bacterium]